MANRLKTILLTSSLLCLAGPISVYAQNASNSTNTNPVPQNSKSNQQILFNTHQIGVNPLAILNFNPDAPFGEGGMQKSMLSYRFLNKTNFNPFLNFGSRFNRQQTEVDPNNGTIDEKRIRTLHISGGVDHRFYITRRFGIYGGLGYMYTAKHDIAASKFNTGSSVQETSLTRSTEQNGIFFSGTFEYSLNPHWKIATRLEYRKLLVTKSEVFNNNFYPDLRTETKSNNIADQILWPCQLIIQYNLSTI